MHGLLYSSFYTAVPFHVGEQITHINVPLHVFGVAFQDVREFRVVFGTMIPVQDVDEPRNVMLSKIMTSLDILELCLHKKVDVLDIPCLRSPITAHHLEIEICLWQCMILANTANPIEILRKFKTILTDVGVG